MEYLHSWQTQLLIYYAYMYTLDEFDGDG